MTTLNKRERVIVRHACMSAIDWYYGLIDAHKVGYHERRLRPTKCFPKEFRAEVRRWNGYIKQFKRMIDKTYGGDSCVKTMKKTKAK